MQARSLDHFTVTGQYALFHIGLIFFVLFAVLPTLTSCVELHCLKRNRRKGEALRDLTHNLRICLNDFRAQGTTTRYGHQVILKILEWGGVEGFRRSRREIKREPLFDKEGTTKTTF
jgi:hypothetical protein